MQINSNMMTLLYMFGLAAGSLVAYSLENILNPVEDHPCGITTNNPIQAKTIEVTNTTVDTTNLVHLLSSYISTGTDLNSTNDK
ncbi:hypothetical protein NQ314_001889 [Rhamnusium bicolor]|uniref:Uncharacterized protein n=1 Tax=Rhamnusium bicolor TaxID=1586634 RepID=A0AAV8ZTL5_9CUCU|nr:hypothetical protein NQ314_001889 [Rhamnusium bicolor]